MLQHDNFHKQDTLSIRYNGQLPRAPRFQMLQMRQTRNNVLTFSQTISISEQILDTEENKDGKAFYSKVQNQNYFSFPVFTEFHTFNGLYGWQFTLAGKEKAAFCVATFDILYLQIFPEHAVIAQGKAKLQLQSFVTLALDYVIWIRN